jgi:hypothetical protein
MAKKESPQSGAKAPSKATKPAAPKRPMGRPSMYSDELANTIMSRIANGESVRKICTEPNMPSQDTFFRWVFDKPEFSEKYTKALEIKADIMRDEILEIADDGSNDTYIDKDGNERTNAEVVARSRLRVDTRKWLMARQAPRKYGDKMDVNHGVQPENPLASMLQRIAGTGLPVVKDDDE